MKIPEAESADEMALNLTPMIDVVFLLLIFFMVATTFLDPEREIGIELPPAESAAVIELDAEQIVINVLEDGSVTVSGQPVTLEELDLALQRAARKDPTTPVTIRGDRRVEHQSIVRVMDACGTAGLRSLAVGTIEGS